MKAVPHWPDEQTLIPDLLDRLPQARSVLDRYGLRGCGGRNGPVEPLGFFARAHDVPIDQLLGEIRAVQQSDRSSEPPEGSTGNVADENVPGDQPAAGPGPTIGGQLPILDNPEPRPEDAIYRPFFKAGILVVLSLGAVWGAYLLLRIAFAGRFAAAGLHDVNAHGHAQIFGWVGLFVMGFAYQAFPRFKHTSLIWPRVAFATLWMMLIGLVVRSLAQPAAAQMLWAFWPAVGASVLEVAAAVLFAVVIIRTWQGSGRGLAFYDGYILSALVWFVIQAVYESVYLTATLSVKGDMLLALVSTWQPALRDLQIHGFALMMILGVSQRIFHHFYGLPQPSARLSRIVLVVLNAAIIGEATGMVLMRTGSSAWSGFWYASVVVLAAATMALVLSWRIFSHTDEGDRSLKFLRAAYLWLFVSFAMLVFLPVYQHGLLPLLAPGSDAVRLGFSHAYYGAIRHAITVGFVSLMIVGVAAKVVPTLNGVPAKWLSPLWGPFLLINLGCSLRVVGQTATDITAAAFPFAGVSGLLEVTGLGLWGIHLWMVMSGRARLRSVPSQPVPMPALTQGVPINGGHLVGAVLEQSPELLDVFTAYGFTTLTNPQFRRTIARVVTIEKACRRMGIDQQEFLAALNHRRQPIPEESSCGCHGSATLTPQKIADRFSECPQHEDQHAHAPVR